MPWFRVDDGFHSHPKTLATPAAAIGLWTIAGSWSSAHLTEGYIPADVLTRLLPDAGKLAEQLVASGLWKRRRNGYQFHDFLARNPSKTEVEQLREKRAEAGRKGGLASGKTRSTREANASVNASSKNEPPSLPVPTHKNGSVVADTDRGLSTAARRPDFPSASPNPGGAASRQPPPFTEAVAAALNPERTWDAFRKDTT